MKDSNALLLESMAGREAASIFTLPVVMQTPLIEAILRTRVLPPNMCSEDRVKFELMLVRARAACCLAPRHC